MPLLPPSPPEASLSIRADDMDLVPGGSQTTELKVQRIHYTGPVRLAFFAGGMIDCPRELVVEANRDSVRLMVTASLGARPGPQSIQMTAAMNAGDPMPMTPVRVSIRPLPSPPAETTVPIVKDPPEPRRLPALEPAVIGIWLRQHDTAHGKKEETALKEVAAFAFSPDGKKVVAGGRDKLVVINRRTGYFLSAIEDIKGRVSCVSFSPDGKFLLASQDADGNLPCGFPTLRDAESGKVVRELVTPSPMVHSAVFSPDGKYILTAGEDGSARLFDATEDRVRATFPANKEPLYCAAAATGPVLLTAGKEGIARIWDGDGKELRQLKPTPASPIVSADLSVDGRRAITVGQDQSVRLWDVTEGKEIRAVTGQTVPRGGIAFWPEDRLADVAGSVGGTTHGRAVFAADSKSGTFSLWDLETGEKFADMSPPGYVGLMDKRVTLAPDGQALAIIIGPHLSQLYDTIIYLPLKKP